MASPLTWRNVDAPDFRGVMQGRQIAANAFDRAFTGLSGSLDKFQDYRKDSAESQVLNAAMGFTDPQSLRAAIADGRVFAGVDRSLLGRQALGAVNNQAGALLTQAVQQHGLDNSRIRDPLENRNLQIRGDQGAFDLNFAQRTAGLREEALRLGNASTAAGTESTREGTIGKRWDNNLFAATIGDRVEQYGLATERARYGNTAAALGIAGDANKLSREEEERADASFATAQTERIVRESNGDPNRAAALFTAMDGGSTRGRAAVFAELNRRGAWTPEAAAKVDPNQEAVTPGRGPDAPRPRANVDQILDSAGVPRPRARMTGFMAQEMQEAIQIPDPVARNARMTEIQIARSRQIGRNPAVAVTSPATQAIATAGGMPVGNGDGAPIRPTNQGSTGVPAPVTTGSNSARVDALLTQQAGERAALGTGNLAAPSAPAPSVQPAAAPVAARPTTPVDTTASEIARLSAPELAARTSTINRNVEQTVVQARRAMSQGQSGLGAKYDELLGSRQLFPEVVADLVKNGALGDMQAPEIRQRIRDIQAMTPPGVTPPNDAQAGAILADSVGGAQAAWFSHQGALGFDLNSPRWRNEILQPQLRANVEAVTRQDAATARDVGRAQEARIARVEDTRKQIETMQAELLRERAQANQNGVRNSPRVEALARRIATTEERLGGLVAELNLPANQPKYAPAADAGGRRTPPAPGVPRPVVELDMFNLLGRQ